MKKNQLSRRDFLKGAAAGALGVAATGLLGACSPAAETTAAETQAATMDVLETTTAAAAYTSPETTSPAETVPAPEASAPASLPQGVPAWLGLEPQIGYEQVVAAYDTEVLVVGSGSAGWPAFAAALENGANAILAERLNALSSPKGDIGSIGSRKQLESIQNDPSLAIDRHEVVKDIVRYSANDIDSRLWYIWADESAETLDWYTDLLEAHDYTMWHEAGIGNASGGNRDKAYATGHSQAANSENTPAVSEVLKNYTEGLGGQILLETTLEKLVKDEKGRVTGAICTNADGDYILINASKGVIIATGGYSGNTEMLRQRQPLALKLASRQGSADNGSGIKAALWAGAHMQDTALSMFFNRTAILPTEVSGYETKGQNFWFGEQPFLKVNLRGERFTNESGLYEYMTHTVQYQPDYTYCDIWDSTFVEDCERFEMVGCCRLFPFPNGAPSNWTMERAIEKNEELIEKGYIQVADTLEELAQKLNIPVETFVKTVERYNELEAKGHDDDFGKVAYRLSRLDTPPYYGVRASAWHLCTLDGVLINTKMQALDEHMEPIPGLYVCGDASGGTFAHVYPNLCTGLACGRSMTFGRRAGRIAAASEPAAIAPVEIGGPEASRKNQAAAGDGNGAYSATATGMGEITVTITFADGVVSDVVIDASHETAGDGYGQAAAPKLAEAIKAANSPVVDAVAGASITSSAVVKAAKDCFAQAGVAFTE